MRGRIAYVAVLFAMGAYVSVSLFVDDWEGRYCWDLGSSNYVRSSFGFAFINAWNELLSTAKGPIFVFAILIYTAFFWAVLAVAIAPRPVIITIAGFVIGLPFALTVYEKIAVGFDAYCDGHGEAALGGAGIQLLFVLPLGIILLIIAFAGTKRS